MKLHAQSQDRTETAGPIARPGSADDLSRGYDGYVSATHAARSTGEIDQVMLSFASMEGLPLLDGAASTQRFDLEWVRSLARGFLLVLVIAVAAFWLAQITKAPLMLCALGLGMVFNYLLLDKQSRPGIDFASRNVLRFGVALLGVRVTVGQIAGLGLMPILTVIAGTLSTILVGVVVARMLGLKQTLGLLSGSAVGICGASAALAVSSVLPNWRERERDTILTVVVVTGLSTVVMIAYPLLAKALGLDHVEAAIFFGGAIHDVAQVVGAGYMISPETGDIATYVKLLRVAMLLPISFAAAFFFSRASGQGGAARPPLPMFLLGFALLVGINSMELLPRIAVSFISGLSQWCLALAIVALGIKTSFRALASAGWRPILLMTIETIWIAAFILSAIFYFG
jgi:uncharacterized integral membrane protein (TIGR00698 family)